MVIIMQSGVAESEVDAAAVGRSVAQPARPGVGEDAGE